VETPPLTDRTLAIIRAVLAHPGGDGFTATDMANATGIAAATVTSILSRLSGFGRHPPGAGGPAAAATRPDCAICTGCRQGAAQRAGQGADQGAGQGAGPATRTEAGRPVRHTTHTPRVSHGVMIGVL
jgi:hypothetical protein